MTDADGRATAGGRDEGGTPRETTACRGLRGATTVAELDAGSVAAATGELLEELRAANGFEPDDVAAAIFTLPDELAGTNPAAAAREGGWGTVPLLMVREHGGDARVSMCLRVLLLVNTTRRQSEIRHVYLRGAVELRPDLATLS
jgi:chorismate mutase